MLQDIQSEQIWETLLVEY